LCSGSAEALVGLEIPLLLPLNLPLALLYGPVEVLHLPFVEIGRGHLRDGEPGQQGS
jgi:hypothetical protein